MRRPAGAGASGVRMKTYPIMLDVRGRLCVVVGAGAVGLRKAEALSQAGAKVRLIGPDTAGRPVPAGAEVLARGYAEGDLSGALLVFACTDDGELNARIAADARAGGALANVADDPEHCDFFAAAAVNDGDVVVAIGTGGASPALAGEIRSKLARHLPERVGEFAAALERVRQHVQRRAADPGRRKAVLKELAGEAGYKVFVEAGWEGLMAMAELALEAT